MPGNMRFTGGTATKLLARLGGRLFVRSDGAVIVEGSPRPRTAIFEFDTLDQAKAFWESDE